jgi:hypothetical protein
MLPRAARGEALGLGRAVLLLFVVRVAPLLLLLPTSSVAGAASAPTSSGAASLASAAFSSAVHGRATDTLVAVHACI